MNQIVYTPINPVAIDFGFVQLHWYGLMYVFAFATAYILARLRMNNDWDTKSLENLIFYGSIGVVVGGRVGYVLFYNFAAFLENPLYLFYVNQGGMSFHGGLLGVLFALYLFNKKYKKTFFQTMDFVAPFVPPGLLYGRIGNFINSELWGRETDSMFGVAVKTSSGELLTRYPSQLYQAFLEGLVLFIILWFFSKKPRPTGSISGLFLIFYGIFRFLVEFVRAPDSNIGYIAFNWLTMGQILSFPMIIIGVLLFYYSYNNKFENKIHKKSYTKSNKNKTIAKKIRKNK